MRSGFGGAIGAVIAPIMDIFRPTRKDETINNVRVYGEGATSISKGPVYNPQDTTPTTIKETNLHTVDFNINNQKESIYVNNYSAPDLTQRDTTSSSYVGTAGGAAVQYGDMSYAAAYRQHNNDVKSSTITNRANMGGTQIFNQQMNVTTIKDDNDRYAGRVNPIGSTLATLSPSVQTLGAIAMPQNYNDAFSCDRIQPDILKAFRENPFTHPLTTSV
jgi:hypothetical protein